MTSRGDGKHPKVRPRASQVGRLIRERRRRESLKEEATRLASYIRVYRLLYERRNDRFEEMNIAPAFFSVVTDGLLSAIVLWFDKLFDENSDDHYSFSGRTFEMAFRRSTVRSRSAPPTKSSTFWFWTTWINGSVRKLSGHLKLQCEKIQERPISVEDFRSAERSQQCSF